MLLNIENIFSALLGIERRIVGVKLFTEKKSYESFFAPEAKAPLYYCALVKMATKGKKRKANLEKFCCTAAARNLGLLKDKDIDEIAMEYWQLGTYKDFPTAQKVIVNTPKISEKIYGVGVLPLGEFEDAPDVVIAIVKPYQAMRLIQAYRYFSGEDLSLKMTGMHGICAESTAWPYLTGKLNVSLLCSGTRFIAKWDDTELAVSFSGKLLLNMLEGLQKTLNPCETDAKKQEILRRSEYSFDITFKSSYFY